MTSASTPYRPTWPAHWPGAKRDAAQVMFEELVPELAGFLATVPRGPVGEAMLEEWMLTRGWQIMCRQLDPGEQNMASIERAAMAAAAKLRELTRGEADQDGPPAEAAE